MKLRSIKDCRTLVVLFLLAGGSHPQSESLHEDEPLLFKPQVFYGAESKVGQFPWQVALLSRRNGGHICGGTLIDKRWVVTAAHCFDGYSRHDFEILAGTVRLSSGGQRFRIRRLIIPVTYRPATLDNDIALIRLKGKANYLAAQLADQEDEATFAQGTLATVSGWGRTDLGVATPDTLMWAPVRIRAPETCRDSPMYKITADMICAASDDGLANFCARDSGGPLVIGETLVGVVSWHSRGCTGEGSYGVYTRVASYSSWIRSEVD